MRSNGRAPACTASCSCATGTSWPKGVGALRPALRHMLYSLSKSFVSTAVGLAVAEGRLTVDDAVVRFFPESLPPTVSDNLAPMRVRHLLSMSTGHDVDVNDAVKNAPDGDWARLPGPARPAPARHALRLQQRRHLHALRHRAAAGGETDNWHTWVAPAGPAGHRRRRGKAARAASTSAAGGWRYARRISRSSASSICAEASGATSKSCRRRGWRRRHAATYATAAPDSDWAQGYGYQFWRCHDTYRGDGAFQFCVVMPEQDAVLAITSGDMEMQRTLDLVWEHLRPAMTDGVLPNDVAAGAVLSERLAALRVPPQGGRRHFPAGGWRVGQALCVSPQTSRGIGAVTISFARKAACSPSPTPLANITSAAATNPGNWARAPLAPASCSRWQAAAHGLP